MTPEQRSERMSRIRSKDTKPEMTVRRLVRGMGYRYRLHRRTRKYPVFFVCTFVYPLVTLRA